MTRFLWLLLFLAPSVQAIVVNGPCPQTAGTLTSPVTSPRLSGISPLLVFFDNSGVASSNVTTSAYQDVNSSWNFGDTLGSGTSKWRYGSNPNQNSRNLGTGNNAAHLYVTEGRDTQYTVTITSTDGVNTVICGLGVTVFDPSGANGFPGAATTCLFNTAVGSGCPSGATQTVASTFAAVGANLSNKRLLYKCGDTFTGGGGTITGTKWSVGAYGACPNTQSSRPTFTATASGTSMIFIANTASDGRISDINLNGAGIANNEIEMDMNVLSTSVSTSKITLYNLTMNGGGGAFISQQMTQFGIIDSDMHARAGTSNIAVFYNVSENNCVNTSNNPYCGLGVGNGVYIVTDYQAMLGSDVEGVGGVGGNVESFRVSAGSKSVYSNSTYNNAISQAANFKFHSGNTYQSCTPWIGKYTQYVEMDNDNFGTTSTVFDVAPQNGSTDERINNVVVERFIGIPAAVTSGGRGTSISAQNVTVRDGVFVLPTAGANYLQNALQTGSRGACQLTGTCSLASGSCPVSESIAGYLPTGLEVFNVTVYSPTGHVGVTAVQNDTSGSWGAPAQNSYFKNVMLYVGTASGYTTVTNTGAGNTISNNTANATLNPAFTNASGLFNALTDFKPTANYTGGATVPVQYDALNVLWPPTWDLGAVHH